MAYVWWNPIVWLIFVTLLAVGWGILRAYAQHYPQLIVSQSPANGSLTVYDLMTEGRPPAGVEGIRIRGDMPVGDMYEIFWNTGSEIVFVESSEHDVVGWLSLVQLIAHAPISSSFVTSTPPHQQILS
ncbi:MAG: hypothetical protein C7B44_06165 [Sulfobacillus thermosulfidooxidans]|nr:MAG: hypothetical protein C7B44_06165 [Sulfobacillus thermosulfidooxidans]